MAHVGEERALGAAGCQRLVARLRQLSGTRLDQTFQVLRQLPQFLISRVKLAALFLEQLLGLLASAALPQKTALEQGRIDRVPLHGFTAA
jgi:hypothetical protein